MAQDEAQTAAAGPPAPDTPPKPPAAWVPLTPRGVAAFATATFNRVLLVVLIVALLAASTISWFVATAWFPLVREAIRQLPESGSMRDRKLLSPHPTPEPLAESRFLALVLNVTDEGDTPSRADVCVEFHQNNFQLGTFLGRLTLDYPAGQSWEFNRPELEPWWGAWEPMLLGLVFLGVVAFLFVCWTALATLYGLGARGLAVFKDRRLTLGGSWRLAAAALMPGALLLTLGLLRYGLGALDLVQLSLVVILHFLVPWAYWIAATLVIPRLPDVPPASSNPFAPPPSSP